MAHTVRVPKATTTAASPAGGPAKVQLKPSLTVHRGAPVPHDLKLLLEDLYQCPDCCSELRWDLKVAVGHDESCPAQKGLT